MTVVVLAGGTGGAKLARGMLDEVGEELVVVANTGDDVEVHGAHVSPDPDLVTFWLADRIDARGWGLEGDTFAVMDALRALGDDVWFNLGDRDLALGLRRARRLAEGASLTEVCAETCAAYGVAARVLPMSDAPVRTRVLAEGRWWPFQEFMIVRGGAGPVQGVEFDGAVEASATPAVLEAIAGARAVVVGPSNPIISIGPILAVPGLARRGAGDARPRRRGLARRGRRRREGPDRAVPGLGRARAVRRRGRGAVRRPARRHGGRRATSARPTPSPRSAPTRSWPTPARGGASPARRWPSRRRWRREDGRRPPRQALRAPRSSAWARSSPPGRAAP